MCHNHSLLATVDGYDDGRKDAGTYPDGTLVPGGFLSPWADDLRFASSTHEGWAAGLGHYCIKLPLLFTGCCHLCLTLENTGTVETHAVTCRLASSACEPRRAPPVCPRPPGRPG